MVRILALSLSLLVGCATASGGVAPSGAPSPASSGGLFTLDGAPATWPGAYLERPRTLLVFMTQWCEVCEREHPAVQRWAGAQQASVRTLVVVSGSPVPEIQRMVERRRMKLEVLVDSDGAVADRFGVQATPTLIMVGSGGAELGRYRAVGELPAELEPVSYELIRDTGQELGTTYESVLLAPSWDLARARADLARARDLVHALDAQLSEWKPDSEISSLNRAAADRVVPLSPELRQIVRGSLHVSAVTDGAFDITWRPLGALWDRAGARGTMPTAEEREAALAAVGFQKIELTDAGLRFLRSDVQLGIGSSAKGWIVDQVWRLLADAGYRQVTVKIGGDLRTSGREADGRSSVFQLLDPYAPDRTVGTLSIADVAIATSGNYFRGRKIGDTFVGHIFDPRTGLPPAFDGSVTVLTHDAAMATSLSTGLFVLGPEAGLALARKLEGVEVVYITREGLKSTLEVGGRPGERGASP